MPRARNLREAYRNFRVEPLRSEREVADFYVDRSGLVSSMLDLKERIELAVPDRQESSEDHENSDRKTGSESEESSEGREKYLFLGFRGSGKSTELCRLEAALDRERFLVVNYSIRESLNLSDFDFRDFFVSMALLVYDVATGQGIALNSDIEKEFLDFARRITNITEEEEEKSKSSGISFSKFFTLKMSREARTREIIRKELDQRISDLIQRLNWMILDIEEKSGKVLVIIVDDLDKLTRGQQSEDFFYKNYQLLTEPSCIVVYTFPIPLAFHPQYETVRHSFGGVVMLPQMPVKKRNGERHEPGRDFYSEVVTRRIEPELLEDGVLDYAIESTGKLSELIEVMKEASLNAHRKDQTRITKGDVSAVLDKLRTTFDRTLSEAHKRRLLDIDRCKEARDEGPDSVLTRELLFNLIAVEYEDEEGRWCEANPLLRPLVERWSQPR